MRRESRGGAGAGSSCEAANCTHCAVTNYYANAQRVSNCAEMARASGEKLGRKYKYFIYHRPDLQLYGIPPYAEWDFSRPPLADASPYRGREPDLASPCAICIAGESGY